MKKIYLLMLGVIFLGMTLTGCKKDKLGDLVVNVVDNSNTPITNEYVYLYNSEAEFNSASYSTKLQTNASGQVKFVDLIPKKYYVDCDFTNQLGGTTTIDGSGTVVAGKQTTITIKP
jgi:hypothetical protein